MTGKIFITLITTLFFISPAMAKNKGKKRIIPQSTFIEMIDPSGIQHTSYNEAKRDLIDALQLQQSGDEHYFGPCIDGQKYRDLRFKIETTSLNATILTVTYKCETNLKRYPSAPPFVGMHEDGTYGMREQRNQVELMTEEEFNQLSAQ